jgi:2-polyprenyl-3-methyl-5-hydroxy-6-metoxy-1,4-benzoquinol methylase
MIRPSDFNDWQEYYWTYQHTLAKRYLIPMLEKQGISIAGKSIFEIGCGSGGVIEAFAESAERAVGLDVAPFDYTRFGSKRVEYLTADIFDNRQREKYEGAYDVILLRDVIEHLPRKDELFHVCDALLNPRGVMLVTFPPFYSPFGAHQQVHARTTAGRVPYLHLLGRGLYTAYLRWVEKGNKEVVKSARELFDTKTTIRSLRRAIVRSAFEIQHQEYYLIRPSYEIRYGLRPRKVQFLQWIPVLRELCVMGVYMILRKKNRKP